MDYEKGYVCELMDQGGPTDVREAIIQLFYQHLVELNLKTDVWQHLVLE